jgi:NAD(P)-dependent dehydrogenase (short-subunit alcohol dehydrogenase family)
MGTLDGRVVVITGAARGIGREHALLMAAEGARVVVNDLGGGPDGAGADESPACEVATEIRERGGDAVAHGGDVASTTGADDLIRSTLAAYGDLHVLVNNAGVLRDRTLVNMTDQDWDISLRVNLRGHFAPTRAAAAWWRDRAKSGDALVDRAVVNTSSESGVFANAGQTNYAAAKAGAAALVEVWHKELRRYGVRVNGILPRARTRLTENDHNQPKQGRFDRWHPGTVSPFVAYLATAACPVSGQVFVVGGGLVQRAAPWSLDPDWRLDKADRWEVTELAEAVGGLGTPVNVNRDTGYIR